MTTKNDEPLDIKPLSRSVEILEPTETARAHEPHAGASKIDPRAAGAAAFWSHIQGTVMGRHSNSTQGGRIPFGQIRTMKASGLVGFLLFATVGIGLLALVTVGFVVATLTRPLRFLFAPRSKAMQ